MIKVNKLSKKYKGSGDMANAVHQISFEIKEGEMVTFLGPSGCGKTTTLRMIAGLEVPTGGEIQFDGVVMYSKEKRVNVPANKRPIGIVFQSYAIWPHMDVYDNVAFPLKVGRNRLDRKTIRDKVESILEVVGLSDYIHRPSTALSGGQQQRVALARALVREPKVLLLDEPLSNLDASLRGKMREEIRQIQLKTMITTIFVTHDQSEALAVSDRVFVLNAGEIVEEGSPEEIYQRPKKSFTAGFIGTVNVLSGSVCGVRAGELIVETEIGCLSVGGACPGWGDFSCDERVEVFIRPENFILSKEQENGDEWLGEVSLAVFQGDYWDYHIYVEDKLLKVRSYDHTLRLNIGDRVYVTADADRVMLKEPDKGYDTVRSDKERQKVSRYAVALGQGAVGE